MSIPKFRAISLEVLAPRRNDWWTWPGSNRRPPACKAGALPAELHAHSRSHIHSKGFPPIRESVPSLFYPGVKPCFETVLVCSSCRVSVRNENLVSAPDRFAQKLNFKPNWTLRGLLALPKLPKLPEGTVKVALPRLPKE